MSFGFGVGDFLGATQLATDVLEALGALLESEANQNSVIILSFRALQAQRIKELQQELYQKSLYKVQRINSPRPLTADDDEEFRHMIPELDKLLNDYGWSGALPARLTLTDEPQLRQYAITRHYLKRHSNQTH